MNFSFTKAAAVVLLLLLPFHIPAISQSDDNAKAEAVIKKAVETLGGERYLTVRTQVGRGKYSQMRDGAIVSFQNFYDVIVFPDKERTEFKGGGSRSVQVNNGDTGWIYDGEQEQIKEQTEAQIASFKRGMRVSLDNLLRGYWKGSAKLSYIGKRAATLGKRNDVVKLAYDDGLVVEFEFSADEAVPQKAIYKRTDAEGQEIVEEDRYAQFVETGRIKAPYIIDRFTNGKHISRINFENVEYNRSIPDSTFAKPNDVKSLKKQL